MKQSPREPKFVYSDDDASAKSPLAQAFLQERRRLTDITLQVDSAVVKRVFNIDHNAYMDGVIPAKTKELIGLSVSTALRCDDCINYHVIQSWRIGASREEIQESLDIALVIGGTIVIPHLRRACALLDELFRV